MLKVLLERVLADVACRTDRGDGCFVDDGVAVVVSHFEWFMVVYLFKFEL